jgi:hypothetical protein
MPGYDHFSVDFSGEKTRNNCQNHLYISGFWFFFVVHQSPDTMNATSTDVNDVIDSLKSTLSKFKKDIIEWMFLLWFGQIVVYEEYNKIDAGTVEFNTAILNYKSK